MTWAATRVINIDEYRMSLCIVQNAYIYKFTEPISDLIMSDLPASSTKCKETESAIN